MAASLRPSACSGGSLAGWPEEPSLPELECGSSPCPPGPSSSPKGTTQGPQPRCPPSTDSVTVVCTPCTIAAGVLPKASAWYVPQAAWPSGLPLHVHTPVCTRLHTFLCSRQAWAPSSAAVCPLRKFGSGSCIPLPSSSLCPQSAKWPPGTSRPFSAFPFWVFQEDKEQENTSVNSMFLGCLIKRDKIAEELRAGLAGVGSHALPPQNAASG